MTASATWLIPLWARARETREAHGLIHDTYAPEIIERLALDVAPLERMDPLAQLTTQASIAVRTRRIDDEIRRFLEAHPGGTILNLGCGLDARAYRLDNEVADWLDVDLPETIDTRRRFFAETPRRRMLAASLLDVAWPAHVQKQGQALLILCEGTLMYLSPDDVRRLLVGLAAAFRDATVLCDVVGSGVMGEVHPALAALDMQVPVRWCIDRERDIETWHPGIELTDFKSIYDSHPERWASLLWLVPLLKERTRSGIMTLRLRDPSQERE